MTEKIHETVKSIKQSFRLMMNGVASSSMREKGVVYKLNWGVPLTNLQEMATSYGKNYELAIELWKEDIRECHAAGKDAARHDRCLDGKGHDAGDCGNPCVKSSSIRR